MVSEICVFPLSYPISFTSVPVASIHGQPTSGICWLAGDSASTATTLYIRPCSSSSLTTTFIYNIYVIGK